MMRVCLLLLGCSAADAHGRLTVPRPRPPLWAEPGMQGHTSATAIYRWNEPVFTLDGPMSHNGHAYRADSYRCHDFKAETPQTTVTAGAPLGLVWTLDPLPPPPLPPSAPPPETNCAGLADKKKCKITKMVKNCKKKPPKSMKKCQKKCKKDAKTKKLCEQTCCELGF